MSQKVIYYKQVDLDNVDITVPERTKNRYFSYISYHKNPFFVQTPTLKFLRRDDDTVHLAIKPDGHFSQFLGQLEDHLVEYIADNSTRFFRGLRFSKEKIRASIVPTITEQVIQVDLAKYNKILVKDQRDVDQDLENVPTDTECVAILQVAGVTFTKKTIQFCLILHQLKIYVSESLTDWSILCDSDSDADEVDANDAEETVRALESAAISDERSSAIKHEVPIRNDVADIDVTDVEHKVENPAPIENGNAQIDNNNDDDKDLFG